jgi:hypothetical protein
MIVAARALPHPIKAARPVADAAGALFDRVFVSRNLVIGAASAAFLLLRLWTPPAILVTMTATLLRRRAVRT